MSDAYEMEIADLKEDVMQLTMLLDKKDKEIFALQEQLTCPRCGSFELICGHNGKGCCTIENNSKV